jgi:teichoic acid transport system permease protein
MAIGNLKARNASTAFGLLWWVINPLLLGSVYYLVFGVLFPGQRDLGYLMSGMFVFHFTSQAMTGGANSIIQNSRLLANLRFPRLVLPIANLTESFIGFLASLLVLYFLAFPSGSVVTLRYLPWLLVIVPIHLIFNLGLSALTARLAVPFRDINNITPYVTRLWLYLSPIIWPLSFVANLSTLQQRLLELNPLFWMINAYRSALLGNDFELAAFGWSALSALIVGVLGVALFVKYESRIVRYL